MITIIFETHSTTVDNEAGVASGASDAELSPLGERQAAELGARRANERIDAVFCSEQQRSFRTTEIAVAGRAVPIIKDARLNKKPVQLMSHGMRTVEGRWWSALMR